MPRDGAADATPQTAQIFSFDQSLARPGLLARIDRMRVEMAIILRAEDAPGCDPRVSPQRVSQLLDEAHSAFFKDLDACAQIAIDASILSVYAVHKGNWGSHELLPELMQLQKEAVRLTEADRQPENHTSIG